MNTMKTGWYNRAKMAELEHLASDNRRKHIRDGLMWGAGLAAIPMTVGLIGGPAEQRPAEAPTRQVTPNSSSPSHVLPSQVAPSKSHATPVARNEEVSTTQEPQDNNMNKIMHAIHMMESSGGINNKPRFEPGFLRQYGNKGMMPQLRKQFGDQAAASSYGPYQIMLVKAWEMGFKYSPQELSDPAKNKQVAEAIVQKYLDQGLSVRDIFKRYNGADSYADRALKIYNQK